MPTFYSAASGFWDLASTWNTGSHVGGPAGPPGSSDTAIISAGHTVTIRTNLSGLANPVTLQCDAPGTNNGTLTFDPTVTTGLKATMSTINGASTLNINCGTRLAPIRRDVTCTIIATNPNHFRIAGGTLNFQAWGQHREMASTDVYADVLTGAATQGATTITVSNTFNPVPTAGDKLWIVEQDGASNTGPKAELVTISSYSAGTIVLTKPLKYAYTTTFALVYKANKFFVNSLLNADHTSGTMWILGDDLYPSGTGGGRLLITRAGSNANTNNLNSLYSAWTSGTKTWTGTASSAQTFEKGSVVLARDFNVIFRGARTIEFGSSGSGVTDNWKFNFVDIDSWNNGTGLKGVVYYQSNFFDCLDINNGTLGARQVFGYGLGFGLNSASATVNNVINGSTLFGGHSLIRSRIANSNQSSTSILLNIDNSYFEDFVAHSSLNSVIKTPTKCIFKDCGFGATGSNPVVDSPSGCQFDNIHIWGGGSSGGGLNSQGENNAYSNLTFGSTSNGKVLNNLSRSIQFVGLCNRALICGLTLESGEPATIVNFSNPTGLIQPGFVKTTNRSFVEQTFNNYFVYGTVSDDTGLFFTGSPSVKFTHTSSNGIIYHDIPVFLKAGSRSIGIYTNPSTGTWADAPRMVLLKEENSSLHTNDWQTLPSIATQVQSVLTTSTWTQFVLTYNNPTDSVYLLRLISRNGSGTVNWDKLSVV